MNHHLKVIQSVARDDIPAVDFHVHTSWTDGTDSTERMHERAVDLGIEAILFSEHARKTSGDWFPQFAAEVRRLPDDCCKPLIGAEVRVEDFDGRLNISDEVREACDLVMASVHRFPGETVIAKGPASGYSREQAIELEFRLAMAALGRGEAEILGHPFGMCYRRFGIEPPPELMRQLIRESARTGVAFEINAHYHPDPWTLIEWCQSDGALMSLGSNAHTASELGRITRILRGEEDTWSPSASW